MMIKLDDKHNPGIIEVIWLDSLVLNSGEWMDLDDLRENLTEESMYHKSVGYLVGESDVAIALCVSINAQGDAQTKRVSGGMIIPKSAIKETMVLREKTD